MQEPGSDEPREGATGWFDDFSWTAFGLTFSYVALEGMVSFLEGTFSPNGYRHVALPFVWHGGAWYDLLFFPYLNGMVWRHLRFRPPSLAAFVLMGFVVTISLHISWYDGYSGLAEADWVWPDRDSGHWIRDMGVAGFMHCLFMVLEIPLFVTFAFSPIPVPKLWRCAFLLTVFPFFGAILPSLVVNRGSLDSYAFVTFVGILLFTWTVVLVKMKRRD